MSERQEDARPRGNVHARPHRRQRRRRSKFAHGLFSVGHLLVAAGFLLFVGFALAIVQGMRQGDSSALQNANAQRLADLNLPGVRPVQGARPLDWMQIVIWAYLFGMPFVFAAQRVLFWQRTVSGARYLTYALMALWAVVTVVVLVSSVD